MNFLVSQQELGAQLGLDNTITTQNTLIERWINTAQQMVAQAAEWPFLRAPTPLIVQTVPDYTTGTVTTTDGSTTVTFSAGIALSKTGQYIQTSSSNDWYRITAHTAAASTATILPAALADLTTGTYTIRKFHYSLDSTVDRVLSMRQTISPKVLGEMSAEQFMQFEPEQQTTGTPRNFFMLGKDASDIWQFGLYPIPDAEVNLYVEYVKAVTDLSGDTDVSVIPAKWHTSVLLKGAIWQGLNFIGDSRANTARDEFLMGIEEMKKNILPSKSHHRRFASIDDNITNRDILPFPDNFPRGA